MTSFIVEKQGETINFESKFESLNDAKAYIQDKLNYNNFAMSLIEKKKVSEKQIAWMHYLATQDIIDSQTLVEDGEYIGLVKKMNSAGANRRSKFQVRLPGITLSTVNRGANIGCVYVYENNQYVGKITQNGELIGNVSEDVKNLLEDANENLLQLAKIYGHESGCCSICGRKLDDPLSVQMGIGPVCAKKFN